MIALAWCGVFAAQEPAERLGRPGGHTLQKVIGCTSTQALPLTAQALGGVVRIAGIADVAKISAQWGVANPARARVLNSLHNPHSPRPCSGHLTHSHATRNTHTHSHTHTHHSSPSRRLQFTLCLTLRPSLLHAHPPLTRSPPDDDTGARLGLGLASHWPHAASCALTYAALPAHWVTIADPSSAVATTDSTAASVVPIASLIVHISRFFLFLTHGASIV
jgi:hypothetical protein